jgi:hypothetical protein
MEQANELHQRDRAVDLVVSLNDLKKLQKTTHLKP